MSCLRKSEQGQAPTSEPEPGIIPTIIARKRQRNMKVFSVVYWSGASPRTGYSKSAHAAHGLGGEALAGQAFQLQSTDSCHVT